DPVGRPFHGEGAGHGEDAGLGRGGRDHERGAGPGVGGHDVEDRSAAAAADHVAPDGEGRVEGAVEHRLHHGVERVGREVLGGGEEVAGRVVDEDVDPAEPVDHGGGERLDLIEVPDV